MTTAAEWVAFLGAQLDEDEAAAEAVRADQDYADSEHQERWNPARVLREVAAKRALIKDLLDSKHFLDDTEWYGCQAIDEDDKPTGRECTCGRDADVERRLALLGGIYSGHPDYPKD